MGKAPEKLNKINNYKLIIDSFIEQIDIKKDQENNDALRFRFNLLKRHFSDINLARTLVLNQNISDHQKHGKHMLYLASCISTHSEFAIIKQVVFKYVISLKENYNSEIQSVPVITLIKNVNEVQNSLQTHYHSELGHSLAMRVNNKHTCDTADWNTLRRIEETCLDFLINSAKKQGQESLLTTHHFEHLITHNVQNSLKSYEEIYLKEINDLEERIKKGSVIALREKERTTHTYHIFSKIVINSILHKQCTFAPLNKFFNEAKEQHIFKNTFLKETHIFIDDVLTILKTA